MAVRNVEVAELFERTADLLEIDGANPFRVRAYRSAALTLRGLPRPLTALLKEGEDLSELPDIGADLAGKIEDIVATGRFALLDELSERVPPALADLLRVPGLGPKRVRALHRALGVRGPQDLLAAARAGRVAELSGFGARTQQGILDALGAAPEGPARTAWTAAEPVVDDLLAFLRGLPGVHAAEVAGSFRRHRETVGDLDLLVACRFGARVTEAFVAHEDVARVLARGPRKASVRLRTALQVDLRVVDRDAWGAALLYFTGSKAHNVALRKRAVARGWKLNEYGLHTARRRVAGHTEAGVYAKLGLAYVEPELREDRGELEAAEAGTLPHLIELAHLRGDLHVHSVASDGTATLEELAEAARARGLAYLAITDHTHAARIAGGLDARRMRRHLARIDAVNAKLRGVRLLRSAEVDILPDGKLDLPRGVLDDLELVVGAVHSAFHLSRAKQTARILRALDDPHFHVLAHPTGRRIGERQPYAVDFERILDAAAEHGCALEVNAQPARLDLDDVHCRAAKERGVHLALSTDAHSVDELDHLRLAVAVARRGWIEREDVWNARPWSQLARLLRR